MNWNPDIAIFHLGSFQLRYYSLFFIIAFIFSYQIMKRIFKIEGKPLDKLDSLIYVYGILGTLLGARLGHVIFYDWAYFSKNILEIFLPFRFTPEFQFTGFAGLASHGAAIGILLSIYIFSRKNPSFRWIWLVDRAVMPVTLAAVFIRLGNFMNSEIKGKIVDKGFAFAVRFIRGGDLHPYEAMRITGAKNVDGAYDMIATNPKFVGTLQSIPFRHPVQLYESVFYLFTFIVLAFIYHRTDKSNRSGFIFGTFLILVFTGRFIAEFFKQSQGGFESYLGGSLSTGQWLSIPLALFGVYLLLVKNNIFETRKN